MAPGTGLGSSTIVLSSINHGVTSPLYVKILTYKVSAQTQWLTLPKSLNLLEYIKSLHFFTMFSINYLLLSYQSSQYSCFSPLDAFRIEAFIVFISGLLEK